MVGLTIPRCLLSQNPEQKGGTVACQRIVELSVNFLNLSDLMSE